MINLAIYSHRSLLGALLGLGFVFLMLGNGLVTLTHPDEVFYVQTAREMVERGDWLTPYIFGHPQFEKPVFFYWLLAVGIMLFGPDPFVARFSPAFFGILGVIAVYWISWMMFGRKRLSFFAGLILATSFIYFGMARAVLTDMVFSVWIVAALAFFYWAYTTPRYKDAGTILFFICGALGVLTKGLLGIGFPLLIVHIYLRCKKDLGFFNGRAGVIGLLLFLAISAPWHLEMVRLHGQGFIDEYWYNVHIRRLFEAEHPRCDTWFFYPGSIVGGMMPWSFFLFPALFLMGKKIWHRTDAHRSQLLFLLVWILGIFVVQQLAKSKLTSYILPLFPALAIIIAYYFEYAADRMNARSFPLGIKLAGSGLAAFITTAAGAAIFYANRFTDILPDRSPVYVFAALLVLCAAGIIIAVQKRRLEGVIAAAMNIVLAVLITVALGHKAIEPMVSCKAITDILKQENQANSVLAASKVYVRAVYFYTGRDVTVIDGAGKGYFSKHPIPFLDEEPTIRSFLREHPVIFGVFRKGTLEIVLNIIGQGPYRVTIVTKIADKYLVKIEQLK